MNLKEELRTISKKNQDELKEMKIQKTLDFIANELPNYLKGEANKGKVSYTFNPVYSDLDMYTLKTWCKEQGFVFCPDGDGNEFRIMW
jgi:hypothetical protein